MLPAVPTAGMGATDACGTAAVTEDASPSSALLVTAMLIRLFAITALSTELLYVSATVLICINAETLAAPPDAFSVTHSQY